MSFYERYQLACQKENIKPCSKQIADALGVTKSTISVWQRKQKIPNGQTLISISKALNVSSDYLLELSEDGLNAEKGQEFSNIITMYERLDEHDRLILEGFIQGMLVNPKYNQ